MSLYSQATTSSGARSFTATSLMAPVIDVLSNGFRSIFSTTASSLRDTEDAIARIEEFAELDANWDGQGSIAPSKKIKDIAIACARVIFSHAAFAEVTVLPHGTIAFDWDTDIGNANLEIGENTFSFYLTLGEKFYPLAGLSTQIPIDDLARIISSRLLYSPTATETRPTSYIPANVDRTAYAAA